MDEVKNKKKINFEEYGITFTEEEFENLSREELIECKERIEKIKKLINE